MPSISGDLRFFGLDLTNAWQQVRQPWLRMHEWPALRWLTPAAPVRVLYADGTEACWLGVRRRAATPAATVPRTVAVALPDELTLRRQVALPAMAQADAEKALSLQVGGLSPFADGDLAWGWRSTSKGDGTLEVDLALASRKQIAQHIDTLAARLAGARAPEVWVCPDAGPPIVLAGYGEAQRAEDARRQRRMGYGLLAAMALLVAAIVLTPTAQLWLRARDALQSHQELALRARPALAQREGLLAATAPLTAMGEILEDRVDPLRVLDLLTRVLPDDTALQNLKLQGHAVTISGLTADAARLMQLLGEQEGLRDVRAPTAATRAAGAGKENFTIAFQLAGKAFAFEQAASAASAASVAQAAPSAAGVPASPASAAPAASAASAAVAASAVRPPPVAVVPAPPPAAVPAAPAAAAPVPAPASTGKPVFGGTSGDSRPPAPTKEPS